MIRLRLDEVFAAADVRWFAGRTRPADIDVDAVSTDTRSLTPGSLFVAINGPSFDGAAFAPAAIEAGAIAILANDEPGARERLAKLCVGHDVAVATCSDVIVALGRIAAAARERSSARVIGITGSCGKTSTKDALAVLLSASRRTTWSRASFNNDIGVPLTLLSAETDTEVLVVEIGTNHPGEIAPLAALARPHVAIVTNIGRSHLEGLGSVEGVAREKGELVAAVDPAFVDGAAVVLNRDCPETPRLLRRVREGVRVFTVSAAGDPSASLMARDVRLVREGTRFVIDGPALPPELRGRTLCAPLLGEHAVANLLAAIAAVLAAGADVRAALDAIASAAPAPHRLEPRSVGGVLIVDDAYNANPESMTAALEVLARMELPRSGNESPQRVLAVGEMGELGISAVLLHREIGERVRALGIDRVVGVGDAAPRTPLRALLEAARAPGISIDHAATVEEAAALLLEGPERLVPGDVLLVKASRAVGLDRLVESIAAALAAPAAEVKL